MSITHPLADPGAATAPSLRKTLTRHGNSLALILDKPILDLLGIGEGTPLLITTDGRRIILSPAPEPVRKAKLDAAMKDADTKFGRMFKRLAE